MQKRTITRTTVTFGGPAPLPLRRQVRDPIAFLIGLAFGLAIGAGFVLSFT